LSAGTYYFTTPPNNRNLVRVEDKSRKVVAHFVGVPDHTAPSPHAMIIFGDHDCGPKTIKLWFHPSGAGAIRFVYPKEEATSIAASCNESVPETDLKTQDASQIRSDNVRLISPQRKEERYKSESLSASDQSDKDGFDADPQ
jgi:hypothetical protein